MGQTLEILLATYNGAAHLEAFLDSLLEQTEAGFTLRVRDDGSTDGTAEILRTYQPRFEGRMILLDTDAPTGSAKGNFSRLMEAATGVHILFADQDDVWTPDHVAVIAELLRKAEAETSPDTPVYAFTDVTPVDGALTPLNDSFFAFKGIDPAIARRLRQSVVCPPMLGCASGINRALLRLALPVPVDQVTGHDWWALLLASAAGHCVWSRSSTVLYRLHDNNASSQVASSVQNYARFSNKSAKVRRGMTLRRLQANAVRDRVRDMVPPKTLAVLDGFDQLMDKGFVQRRISLVSGGYLYPDATRTLGMLALC